MKRKHYSVNGNKVFAEVVKLTDKETKEVKKYLMLGFELVPITKEVTKEEEAKLKEERKVEKAKEAEERKNNPYAKENVEAFLNKKGNEKLLEEYKKRYNEQAGTNRTRTNEKGQVIAIQDEPKYKKNGEPKIKGYANCIGWFRGMYEYNEELKDYKLVK